MTDRLKKADTPVRDVITVTSGKEIYAPVPYFSFEVGPVSMTSDIRETETYEDCYQRCAEHVALAQEDQFMKKMRGFFDRIKILDEHMLSQGLAPRVQREVVRESSSKLQADMSKPAEDTQPEGPLGFRGDPVASSPQLRATPAQLTLLKRLGDMAKVNTDTLCFEVFGCGLGEICKPAMSKLLDYVERIGKGTDSLPDGSKAGGPDDGGGKATVQDAMSAHPSQVEDDDIPF